MELSLLLASADAARLQRSPIIKAARSGRSRSQAVQMVWHDSLDRELAAQGLADAPVTLLTFDTSQAARARRTELTVKKLTKPLDRDHRPEARPLHSLRYLRRSGSGHGVRGR